MFGISAFAQSPYASLGGAFYDVIVNETQTLTDAQTGFVAFLAAQTNTQTLTDTNVSQFAFLGATSDLIPLSDYQFGGGWFKINDNQSTVWRPVSNSRELFIQWVNQSNYVVKWLNNTGGVVNWSSLTSLQTWHQINNNQ